MTDRSMICRLSDADAALTVLPWLVKHDRPSLSNPEQVLKHFFHARGLRVLRHPRTQVVAVVRHAPTRWKRKGELEPVPGMCSSTLLMKYPYEYPMVARTCRRHFPTCNSSSAMGKWLNEIRLQLAEDV